jgi:hypothetical protein
MTSKMAGKILRRYSWAMCKHNAGVSEAPRWLQRLWRKATGARLREGG